MSETAWEGVNCVALAQTVSIWGECFHQSNVHQLLKMQSDPYTYLILFWWLLTNRCNQTRSACINDPHRESFLSAVGLYWEHREREKPFAMCSGGWCLLQERKHLIKIRYFRSLETGVTTKYRHVLIIFRWGIPVVYSIINRILTYCMEQSHSSEANWFCS